MNSQMLLSLLNQRGSSQVRLAVRHPHLRGGGDIAFGNNGDDLMEN